MSLFHTITSDPLKTSSHFLNQSNLYAKEWAGHSVRFIQGITYFFAVRPNQTASFIVTVNAIALLVSDLWIQPVRQRIVNFLEIKEEKDLKNELVGYGILTCSATVINLSLYHLTWGALHPFFFGMMVVSSIVSRFAMNKFDQRKAFNIKKEAFHIADATRKTKIDTLENEIKILTVKKQKFEKQIEVFGKNEQSIKTEKNNLENDFEKIKKDIADLSNPAKAEKILKDKFKKKYDSKQFDTLKNQCLIDWAKDKDKIEGKLKDKDLELNELQKKKLAPINEKNKLAKEIELLDLQLQRNILDSELAKAEIEGNSADIKEKSSKIDEIDLQIKKQFQQQEKEKQKDLEEQAKKNQNNLAELQSQLDDKKNETLVLGSNKESLEKQVRDLDKAKTETEGNLADLRRDFSDLKSKKEDLERQKNTMEQQKRDDDAKISQQKKEYKKLSALYNDVVGQKNEKENNNRRLENDYRKLKEVHEKTTNASADKITKLTNEHEKEIQKLKQDIENNKRLREEVEAKNTTLCQTISRISGEISDTEQELKKAKNKIEELNSKITNHKEEIATTGHKSSQLEASLRLQMASLKTEKEKEIAGLKEKIETHERNGRIAIKQYNELQGKLDNFINQYEDLLKKKEELQKEVEKLKNQKSDSQGTPSTMTSPKTTHPARLEMTKEDTSGEKEQNNNSGEVGLFEKGKRFIKSPFGKNNEKDPKKDKSDSKNKKKEGSKGGAVSQPMTQSPSQQHHVLSAKQEEASEEDPSSVHAEANDVKEGEGEPAGGKSTPPEKVLSPSTRRKKDPEEDPDQRGSSYHDPLNEIK